MCIKQHPMWPLTMHIMFITMYVMQQFRQDMRNNKECYGEILNA